MVGHTTNNVHIKPRTKTFKNQMGKKLERERRLEQEAGRHWEEITLGDFLYDR